MLRDRLFDLAQGFVFVEFLLRSASVLTRKVGVVGGTHFDYCLLPRTQLAEGVPIRTDKYQTDVFEHKADVGVYKARSIELRQTDR